MAACRRQFLSRSRLCASRIKGGTRYIDRPTNDGRSVRACPQPPPYRGMSLTTSLESQQPHQHDEPSSEFHGQLDGPRDGGDTSTSPTGQQALPGITDPAYPGPPRPLGPSVHAGFDLPGWKRLTHGPLATHEQISLITTIFSNQDEIEMIKRLCGEDAQIFIDTIFKVRSYILVQGIGPLTPIQTSVSYHRPDVG